METKDLIPLVLLIMFIVIAIPVVFSIFGFSLNFINDFFCSQSGDLRSMFSGFLGTFASALIEDVFKSNLFDSIPLICKVNEYSIDNTDSENINEIVAGEIESCWEKFGQSQKNPIFPLSSFLCSKIVINTTENPVDLMKVYSLVYNTTNLAEYESFNINDNYQIDTSNPFRFCIDSNYQIMLNKELYENGMSLSQIQDSVIITNNNYYTVGSEEIKTPLCLSLKEASTNLYRVNDYYQTLCSSLCTNNNYETTSNECSAFCDLTLGNSTENSIQSKINIYDGYTNTSTIIYSGTIYIRYYDYSYWLHNYDDTSFLMNSETGNFIFSLNTNEFDDFIEEIDSIMDLDFLSDNLNENELLIDLINPSIFDLLDFLSGLDDIANKNRHDYVIIGYSPKISEVEE